MKLYHFTAERFIENIKREGLTKGGIPLITPDGIKYEENVQWLTTNNNFTQDWCDQKILLSYSRTDFRITVKIPKTSKNLFRWIDICNKPEYKPTTYFLNSAGVPENWFVYFGNIKPNWFREILVNPSL